MIETPLPAVTDGHVAPHDDDLLDLAHHMSDLGHLEDALAMAQQAVAIYRQLALLHPDFTPELIRALTDVGALVSELSWRLALAPANEALALYRQLTESDLAAAMDVALPLSNLLTFLAEMGTCPPATD